MSRTLSLAMLVALYAQQTGDVIIPLLTIEHPDMEPEDILHFALNTKPVISRGVTYIAFPFDIIVPDDADDTPPQAVLTVSNVDQRMAAFLEMSIIPPTITIEIIRIVGGHLPFYGSAMFGVDVFPGGLDTVEASWTGLTLRSVKYNRQNISGNLTYEKMVSEGYPKGIFSPSYFPGMF